MQAAIGGVVGDRSVATRPAVQRVEKEKVVRRAEVIILGPRLSAGCMLFSTDLF